MKKSHIYIILICVVVSIAAAFFLHDQKIKKLEKDRSTCIINIRNVQQAVRGYIGMQQGKKPLFSETMWDDIFSGPDALLREPECPSGGTYTFHNPPSINTPLGFLYCTCSHAETLGHKPANTSDW